MCSFLIKSFYRTSSDSTNNEKTAHLGFFGHTQCLNFWVISFFLLQKNFSLLPHKLLFDIFLCCMDDSHVVKSINRKIIFKLSRWSKFFIKIYTAVKLFLAETSISWGSSLSLSSVSVLYFRTKWCGWG